VRKQEKMSGWFGEKESGRCVALFRDGVERKSFASCIAAALLPLPQRAKKQEE
jgi:hypothetical protein